MNLSAIAVCSHPGRGDAVRAAIEALGWAEVHHADELGRLIIVVEGATTDEEVQRLQVLKRLPGVFSAEMVVHWFEDEAAPAPDSPARQERIAADLNREEPGVGGLSYYQILKRLSNG